jgi:stage II sporulation protein D
VLVAPTPVQADEPRLGLGPVVRVGLVSGVSSARVSCHRSFEITSAFRRTGAIRVAAGTTLLVEREAGGAVRVREETGADLGAFAGGVIVYPSEPGTLMQLGGRTYRGYFVVLHRADGLTVVNRLRLENYVRGVVANEIGMGSAETLEALKAQTVAARTYAYAKIEGRSEELFDVEPTEFDQVYSGVAGESPWVNRAVDETLGELLYHDGAIAEALYSSTCGGHSADAREAWGGSGHGHLRAHPDRTGELDLCRASKYYTWRTSWDADALVGIMGRYYAGFFPGAGRPSGRLKDLRVVSRGASGRAVALEVVSDGGRHVIERDRIRWILRRAEPGEPALFSTFFDLDVARRNGSVERVTARGRGFGHGVGMGQMGAIAMSREGRSYREILGHYYRGAELRRPYVEGA